MQTKPLHRRLEQIQPGMGLSEDAGIVEPLHRLVAALIAQLQVRFPRITPCDTKIEKLFESPPDAALFAALPGAGPH
ncbi:MAG: hypothetical protein HC865_10700 [Cyanobacteria bacterium RU_5_0]|nr:hypothetical protein [Cyanobacteria bacterium RU_5_0]